MLSVVPAGILSFTIWPALLFFYFLKISSVKQEPSGQNRPSPEGRLLPETARQTEYPAKPDTVILME